MIRALISLLFVLAFSLDALAAQTIKKLSAMGSSSTNPSVSDDGCYVAFSSGPEIKLYDCSADASSTIAQGYHPALSGNGRYLAFATSSALVSADTNNTDDVYLYDRKEAAFTLVSIAFDGASGNSASFSPAISSTGRYIAFESWASNITSGDANNAADVFVRDMEQPVIKNVLVSVSEAGNQGYLASRNPSISALGDRVAFHSASSNLVPDDFNSVDDIFVRNWENNHTYRASVTASGSEGNGASGTPAISGDGSKVAFSSLASNLVDGDSDGDRDVFLKDFTNGVIYLVSAKGDGYGGNAESGCDDQSFSGNCLGISGSGRFVSFPSSASDLVEGDTNGYADVFLRDVEAASTSRISLEFNGDQANDSSEISSMSTSGRFIAFDSKASLVGNHYESDLDVFLVDRGEDTPNQELFPFVDDFSDGTVRGDDEWTVKKGKWQVTSTGLYASASGRENLSLVKVLAAKPYRFSTGRIEAEITLSRTKGSGQRAGIVFAYKGGSAYRYVELRPKSIIVGQKGNFGGNKPFLRMKRANVKAGVSYTLRVITKKDGSLNVFLGDRRITSFRFKRSEGGGVGLFSQVARAYFDNVHVWDDPSQ